MRNPADDMTIPVAAAAARRISRVSRPVWTAYLKSSPKPARKRSTPAQTQMLPSVSSHACRRARAAAIGPGTASGASYRASRISCRSSRSGSSVMAAAGSSAGNSPAVAAASSGPRSILGSQTALEGAASRGDAASGEMVDSMVGSGIFSEKSSGPGRTSEASGTRGGAHDLDSAEDISSTLGEVEGTRPIRAASIFSSRALIRSSRRFSIDSVRPMTRKGEKKNQRTPKIKSSTILLDLALVKVPGSRFLPGRARR